MISGCCRRLLIHIGFRGLYKEEELICLLVIRCESDSSTNCLMAGRFFTMENDSMRPKSFSSLKSQISPSSNPVIFRILARALPKLSLKLIPLAIASLTSCEIFVDCSSLNDWVISLIYRSAYFLTPAFTVLPINSTLIARLFLVRCDAIHGFFEP
jgi:hypothetical protein